MSHLITKTVQLVNTSCAACGIDFAIPDWLNQKLHHDGASFYCPRGHSLHFGPGESERLRKKINQLEARNTHLADQRTAAERSAAAFKGQITQLRKRVANGVCPCCHRTFANVARHITSQHPEYANQEA